MFDKEPVDNSKTKHDMSFEDVKELRAILGPGGPYPLNRSLEKIISIDITLDQLEARRTFMENEINYENNNRVSASMYFMQ